MFRTVCVLIVVSVLISGCDQRPKKNTVEVGPRPAPVPKTTCDGRDCVVFSAMPHPACKDYEDLPGVRNKRIYVEPRQPSFTQPISLVWRVKKVLPDGTIFRYTASQKTYISGVTAVNCLAEEERSAETSTTARVLNQLEPLCASNRVDPTVPTCDDFPASSRWPSGYTPKLSRSMTPHGHWLAFNGVLRVTASSESEWLMQSWSTLNAPGFVRVSSNPRDCRRLCSEISSECAVRNVPGDEAHGVQKIINEALKMGLDGTMKMGDVKSVFQIENDPCNRGDITFRGGAIENTGNACTLTTSISTSDTEDRVSIAIPQTLRGRMLPFSGGVVVRFDDPSSAPELVFADSGLNADWGGIVVSLTAEAQQVSLETPHSCVMARLQ